ncbi:aldo/keto reductase [Noviherbaspirillum suwonense]|jgi:diketogulonate reductase-like aldo/keto reductase|uniref:Aldo/keto reductase n=1 Tax=Noviherbaspirillum suwonense TaxID=1224511 RepID=A0ABY1Q8I5_9BURK|nr:aldo/keto reductase [Noviherbaspirillum suwonense]SMP59199.1 Aldo/keto reductase [Noviherbaspirillum suwonense]
MKTFPNDHGDPASMPRARFLRLGAAVAAQLAIAPLHAQGVAAAPAAATRMHQRAIPSSGEQLGIIGCGTWQTFDVGAAAEDRKRLADVLQIMFDAGGSVVDSSPMYGRSEAVTGDLLTQMGKHDRAFVATKVWTRGAAEGVRQMEESMRLLQHKRIELMQIHNLVDWRTHLKTLRAWKAEGRIKYLGITHYTESAFGELEAIMKAEKLDFVQLNYSLGDRAAEARLLPLAAERGIAVLVNQPFGGGGLLRSLADKPLPAWANDIGCASWAQVLLKYVVSHPAVTCAIPGTSRPQHMRDNVAAGMGIVPDAAMRRRMADEWRSR